MTSLSRVLAGALLSMSVLAAAGCASPASMTPQQKEAAELRRYCGQNPDDVVRCLGFLGDH
jgi:hypothetical protein